MGIPGWGGIIFCVIHLYYTGALCEPFIVSTWFLPLNEKEKALFSTKGVWAYTKELTLNRLLLQNPFW